MAGCLLTVSASLNKRFSKGQTKASSSASDDEDAVVKLCDMSVHSPTRVLAEKHTSNSRKRCDGFVSAADGNLCAIAEMLLVAGLTAEHVGV